MRHLKNKSIKIILFSLFVFFFSYNVTFAADSTELGALVVSVVQGFLKIASGLIGMLTQLVSLFLYPGWINGELFKLNEPLKQVWILVSNVVYFIFAFILIWIAFMNIIGTKGSENYELKQSLPKFIIGVLIVPVSWFFVQFVLSVTSILTIAVLTIPFSTFQGYDFFEDIDKNTEPICVEYTLNLGEVPDDATSNDFFRCENEEGGDGKELSISELLNGDGSSEDGLKNSIFGIMSIYTYGILSPDGLDTLAKEDLASVDGLGGLFSVGIKVIFDIVFVLMYLILMVALFLALMTRGVYLWIYTMLSPVFGLMFFFGKSSEGFFGTGDKFSIKEFISLALVPVIASAALSFGLLFIFIVGHGMAADDSTLSKDKETISVGGFSLTIKGPVGDGASVMGKAIGGIQSTIGQIILMMIGLGILWVAVIGSLSTAAVTKAIIDPIQQFGSSVGKLIAKSPTYAPILPGGLSATGLGQFGQNIESSIRQKAISDGGDFASKFLNNGGNVAGETASKNASATIEAGINKRSVSAFRDAMDKFGEVQAMAASDSFRGATDDLAAKLGIKDKDPYKSLNLKNKDDLAKAIALIDSEIERSHGGIGLSILDKDTNGVPYNTITYGTINDDIARRKGGTPSGDSTPAAGTNNIEFDGAKIEVNNSGSTTTLTTAGSTALIGYLDGKGSSKLDTALAKLDMDDSDSERGSVETLIKANLRWDTSLNKFTKAGVGGNIKEIDSVDFNDDGTVKDVKVR